jgi:hypothetical protein
MLHGARRRVHRIDRLEVELGGLARAVVGLSIDDECVERSLHSLGHSLLAHRALALGSLKTTVCAHLEAGARELRGARAARLPRSTRRPPLPTWATVHRSSRGACSSVFAPGSTGPALDRSAKVWTRSNGHWLRAPSNFSRPTAQCRDRRARRSGSKSRCDVRTTSSMELDTAAAAARGGARRAKCMPKNQKNNSLPTGPPSKVGKHGSTSGGYWIRLSTSLSGTVTRVTIRRAACIHSIYDSASRRLSLSLIASLSRIMCPASVL